MSDQLQISGQNAGPDPRAGQFDQSAETDPDTGSDDDGPWPGGLGHGPNAVFGLDDPIPPAPRLANLPSIVGFALAVFVWPAGLVLSVIGLAKSRKLGGTGKVLSIFGLVVSVLVGTLVTTVIVMVSHSTGRDPGCAARVTSSNAGYPSKLYRDDNNLQQDENQNNAAATKTDISTFITDLRVYKGQLDQAISVSVNPSVKKALVTMDGDVDTLATGYQRIEDGDDSQQNQVMAAADRLGPDGAAITNLCSSL